MSDMSEAAAVMTSREPFTLAPTGQAQNPAVSQPQLDQQMRVPYAADGAYGPVGSSPPYQTMPAGTSLIKQNMNLNSGDKRKRGRPRKYGPDGSMSMGMPSTQQPINIAMPQATFSSPSSAPPPTEPPPTVGGSASPTTKKARGRPPGSSNKKKQMEAIGSTGIGFIPHVINVPAGEGRFDILSLSGSFMLSDVGGQKSRTGGLSITLSGPDGRVFGGCVAGLLIAASPVQVIVGSFIADGRKETKSSNYMEPLSVPPKVNLGGGSSSPSRGTFSESSGGAASPLNLSSGACNNNHPQGMSGIPWK